MKYGIALAGGGTRGAAHVGVLLALEENHLLPTAIAGASAGGIVAGLYASGMNAVHLKEVVTDLSIHWRKLIDPNLSGLLKAIGNLACHCSIGLSGLIKGNRLERYFLELIGERPLSSLCMPTIIPAVDLNTGHTIAYVDHLSKRLPLPDVHWTQNALVHEAMRASSAFPVVFRPKKHGELYLVDGGVADNLPVNLLLASGVERVLAVDISSHYEMPKRRDIVEIASHSLSIMQERLKNCTARGEAYCLKPSLPEDAGLLTFDQMIACMEAGYQATIKKLPLIRSALAGSPPRKR
ncbi:MAG: hypothetical protein HFE39_06255 [Clostridiales bacterium]|jgi:NTE family protein|nr:hypothetical protein [Clostridiales bacterium]